MFNIGQRTATNRLVKSIWYYLCLESLRYGIYLCFTTIGFLINIALYENRAQMYFANFVKNGQQGFVQLTA